MLKNFQIDHVKIAAEKAGSIANTDGLVLDDIKLRVPEGDRLKTEDNLNLKGLDTVQYVQALD
jgi:hypothetical protein